MQAINQTCWDPENEGFTCPRSLSKMFHTLVTFMTGNLLHKINYYIVQVYLKHSHREYQLISLECFLCEETWALGINQHRQKKNVQTRTQNVSRATRDGETVYLSITKWKTLKGILYCVWGKNVYRDELLLSYSFHKVHQITLL